MGLAVCIAFSELIVCVAFLSLTVSRDVTAAPDLAACWVLAALGDVETLLVYAPLFASRLFMHLVWAWLVHFFLTNHSQNGQCAHTVCAYRG